MFKRFWLTLKYQSHGQRIVFLLVPLLLLPLWLVNSTVNAVSSARRDWYSVMHRGT